MEKKLTPKQEAKNLIDDMLERIVPQGKAVAHEDIVAAKFCSKVVAEKVIKTVNEVVGSCKTEHDKEIVAYWRMVKQQIKVLAIDINQ